MQQMYPAQQCPAIVTSSVAQLNTLTANQGSVNGVQKDKCSARKDFKLQENNDKMLYMLEEKKAKMEEGQIELDAQLRHKEREFHLQMVQILMQQNTPCHLPQPPVPHLDYTSFNFGSGEYEPDAIQDGL